MRERLAKLDIDAGLRARRPRCRTKLENEITNWTKFIDAQRHQAGMSVRADERERGYDLIVNGKSVHVDSDGTTPLLSVLRDELGLRGSRFGCGTEQCGACMVLIDGEPAFSCAREVATVAGKTVTTVEGLSANGALHPAAAGVPRRAGRPMRLLPLGHPGVGGGAARAQSDAQPRRDRRRARSASLPLRHAQPRHSRGRAGRRRDQGRRMIANTLPQSLIDNPLLSQWIGFEEPGRVRIATGKVEIGQGILTALDADRRRGARRRAGAAAHRVGRDRCQPGRGFHVGQLFGRGRRRLDPPGLRRGALAVPRPPRRHAATARSASCRSRTENSCAPARTTGRDYWSIAGEVVLERRASGTAPTKLPSTYRIVGRSLPRLDLPAKLAGAAFIHDIAPENVVHARVLRQPWRGARLVALDENAVRRAAKAPIEILREGDLVAFTAASEIAVMRAAEAARTLARWDGGEPAPADIGEPDWLKAQPSRDRTVGDRASPAAPAGTAWSRRAIRARFSPMGRSARPARWPSSRTARSRCGRTARARPCCATGSRARSASTTAQVTVLHRQGAGAYGHNTADDAAFDAAFVATRMPGRTVRVQWSREDEFPSAPISTAMAIELRAVLDADNRPADWTIEIWSPPHAQRPGMNGNSNLIGAEALPNAPPRNELNDVPDERGGGATRNAYAIYDLPRHRLIHHLLPHVPLRTSSLRGLGAWANVFAIESFMDELAELAGEDPVSYRLSLLSDPRARRVVETAAQMSGWFDEPPAPAKARRAASASPATRTSPPSRPWWPRSRSTKRCASSGSGAAPMPAW